MAKHGPVFANVLRRVQVQWIDLVLAAARGVCKDRCKKQTIHKHEGSAPRRKKSDSAERKTGRFFDEKWVIVITGNGQAERRCG
jgi:hypothetical protein